MKRFGFWRSISVFAVATLLITALVTPGVAHADDDFTNAPDIDAGVTTEVGAGELVDENNGTITENSGAVNVNNGEIVTNTETGEVITNSETGEIETNYGAIETNEGTVQTNGEGESSISTNLGTVEENNGSITTNGENGTIPTNGEYTGTVEENNSYIGQNLETGVVTVNEGMIESNSGTVVTNKDPEDPENSAVAMPGTVCENTGIVENNEGTVNQNSGVVQENHGTVVNEATGVVEVNHQDGTVNGAGTVNMNLGTGTIADGVTFQKQMWSVGTQNWDQFVTNATSENSYSVRTGNKTELWFDSDATLFIRSGNGIRLTDITVDRVYRDKVNIVKSQDGELLIWKISQLTGNVKLKLVVMSDAEEAEENTDPAQSDEPENAGNGTDTPDKTVSESFFYKKGVTDVLTDSDTDKIHSVIEDIIKKDRNVKYINLYFIDNLNKLSLDVFSTMSNFYGRTFILHFYIDGKPSKLSISSDECKMFCTLALSNTGEDGKGVKYSKNGGVAPAGMAGASGRVGKADASGPVGKADASGPVGKPDSSGDTEWDKQSAIITNIGMLFQHLETDEINFDDLRGFLFNESNGSNQPATGTAGAYDQPEIGIAGANDQPGIPAVSGADWEIKAQKKTYTGEAIQALIYKELGVKASNGDFTNNIDLDLGDSPYLSVDGLRVFMDSTFNTNIHFTLNGLGYTLFLPEGIKKPEAYSQCMDILLHEPGGIADPIRFFQIFTQCGFTLSQE